MEDKENESKRARTVRYEYHRDVEQVQSWICQAEGRVQDRSLEPQTLKEFLQELQCEIGLITDQMDRVSRHGQMICQRTRDENEQQLVRTTLSNLSDQLQQVRSWLEEKRLQVGDSIDSWQRFLQLHSLVLAWVEEKKAFLAEPLHLTSLVQARQKSQDYNMAVKSCKVATKNVSDMGKELSRISQVSSVGALADQMAEAEQSKTEVETLLQERSALLLEMTEEWEQCEKKLKDVRAWLDKARQTLDSPLNKKRPLRDQLSLREKMLGDVTIQKTKINMSIEKLQVHFRSGVTGSPDVVVSSAELIEQLDQLLSEINQQSKTLEAAVIQLDQLQQEIQGLRAQVVQVDQQLRLVSSPAYSPLDRDKALAEQNGLQAHLVAGCQQMHQLRMRIAEIDPNLPQPDDGFERSLMANLQPPTEPSQNSAARNPVQNPTTPTTAQSSNFVAAEVAQVPVAVGELAKSPALLSAQPDAKLTYADIAAGRRSPSISRQGTIDFAPSAPPIEVFEEVQQVRVIAPQESEMPIVQEKPKEDQQQPEQRQRWKASGPGKQPKAEDEQQKARKGQRRRPGLQKRAGSERVASRSGSRDRPASLQKHVSFDVPRNEPQEVQLEPVTQEEQEEKPVEVTERENVSPPAEDKRSRSPFWVPQGPSYADILRGKCMPRQHVGFGGGLIVSTPIEQTKQEAQLISAPSIDEGPYAEDVEITEDAPEHKIETEETIENPVEEKIPEPGWVISQPIYDQRMERLPEQAFQPQFLALDPRFAHVPIPEAAYPPAFDVIAMQRAYANLDLCVPVAYPAQMVPVVEPVINVQCNVQVSAEPIHQESPREPSPQVVEPEPFKHAEEKFTEPVKPVEEKRPIEHLGPKPSYAQILAAGLAQIPPKSRESSHSTSPRPQEEPKPVVPASVEPEDAKRVERGVSEPREPRSRQRRPKISAKSKSFDVKEKEKVPVSKLKHQPDPQVNAQQATKQRIKKKPRVESFAEEDVPEPVPEVLVETAPVKEQKKLESSRSRSPKPEPEMTKAMMTFYGISSEDIEQLISSRSHDSDSEVEKGAAESEKKKKKSHKKKRKSSRVPEDNEDEIEKALREINELDQKAKLKRTYSHEKASDVQAKVEEVKTVKSQRKLKKAASVSGAELPKPFENVKEQLHSHTESSGDTSSGSRSLGQKQRKDRLKKAKTVSFNQEALVPEATTVTVPPPQENEAEFLVLDTQVIETVENLMDDDIVVLETETVSAKSKEHIRQPTLEQVLEDVCTETAPAFEPSIDHVIEEVYAVDDQTVEEPAASDTLKSIEESAKQPKQTEVPIVAEEQAVPVQEQQTPTSLGPILLAEETKERDEFEITQEMPLGSLPAAGMILLPLEVEPSQCIIPAATTVSCLPEDIEQLPILARQQSLAGEELTVEEDFTPACTTPIPPMMQEEEERLSVVTSTEPPETMIYSPVPDPNSLPTQEEMVDIVNAIVQEKEAPAVETPQVCIEVVQQLAQAAPESPQPSGGSLSSPGGDVRAPSGTFGFDDAEHVVLSPQWMRQRSPLGRTYSHDPHTSSSATQSEVPAMIKSYSTDLSGTPATAQKDEGSKSESQTGGEADDEEVEVYWRLREKKKKKKRRVPAQGSSGFSTEMSEFNPSSPLEATQTSTFDDGFQSGVCTPTNQSVTSPESETKEIIVDLSDNTEPIQTEATKDEETAQVPDETTEEVVEDTNEAVPVIEEELLVCEVSKVKTLITSNVKFRSLDITEPEVEPELAIDTTIDEQEVKPTTWAEMVAMCKPKVEEQTEEPEPPARSPHPLPTLVIVGEEQEKHHDDDPEGFHVGRKERKFRKWRSSQSESHDLSDVEAVVAEISAAEAAPIEQKVPPTIDSEPETEEQHPEVKQKPKPPKIAKSLREFEQRKRHSRLSESEREVLELAEAIETNKALPIKVHDKEEHILHLAMDSWPKDLPLNASEKLLGILNQSMEKNEPETTTDACDDSHVKPTSFAEMVALTKPEIAEEIVEIVQVAENQPVGQTHVKPTSWAEMVALGKPKVPEHKEDNEKPEVQVPHHPQPKLVVVGEEHQVHHEEADPEGFHVGRKERKFRKLRSSQSESQDAVSDAEAVIVEAPKEEKQNAPETIGESDDGETLKPEQQTKARAKAKKVAKSVRELEQRRRRSKLSESEQEVLELAEAIAGNLEMPVKEHLVNLHMDSWPNYSTVANVKIAEELFVAALPEESNMETTLPEQAKDLTTNIQNASETVEKIPEPSNDPIETEEATALSFDFETPLTLDDEDETTEVKAKDAPIATIQHDFEVPLTLDDEEPVDAANGPGTGKTWATIVAAYQPSPAPVEEPVEEPIVFKHPHPSLVVVESEFDHHYQTGSDPEGFHIGRKERKFRKWRSSQSESQDLSDTEPNVIQETATQDIQAVVEEVIPEESRAHETEPEKVTEDPHGKQEVHHSKTKSKTHKAAIAVRELEQRKRHARLSESEREVLKLAEAIEKNKQIPLQQSIETTEQSSLEAPSFVEPFEPPPMVDAVEGPSIRKAIEAPMQQQAIEAPQKIEAIEAPQKIEAIEAPPKVDAIAAPVQIQAIQAPPKVEAIEAPAERKAITYSEASTFEFDFECPLTLDEEEESVVLEAEVKAVSHNFDFETPLTLEDEDSEPVASDSKPSDPLSFDFETPLTLDDQEPATAPAVSKPCDDLSFDFEIPLTLDDEDSAPVASESKPSNPLSFDFETPLTLDDEEPAAVPAESKPSVELNFDFETPLTLDDEESVVIDDIESKPSDEINFDFETPLTLDDEEEGFVTVVQPVRATESEKPSAPSWATVVGAIQPKPEEPIEELPEEVIPLKHPPLTFVVVEGEFEKHYETSCDPEGFHIGRKERKFRKWRSSQSESQDFSDVESQAVLEPQVVQQQASPVAAIAELLSPQTSESEEEQSKGHIKQKSKTPKSAIAVRELEQRKRHAKLSESEKEVLELAEAIELNKALPKQTSTEIVEASEMETEEKPILHEIVEISEAVQEENLIIPIDDLVAEVAPVEQSILNTESSSWAKIVADGKPVVTESEELSEEPIRPKHPPPTLVELEAEKHYETECDPEGFHIGRKERKFRKWRSSQSESQDYTTDEEHEPTEKKVLETVPVVVEEEVTISKPCAAPTTKPKDKKPHTPKAAIPVKEMEHRRKRSKLSESEKEVLELAEAIEGKDNTPQLYYDLFNDSWPHPFHLFLREAENKWHCYPATASSEVPKQISPPRELSLEEKAPEISDWSIKESPEEVKPLSWAAMVALSKPAAEEQSIEVTIDLSNQVKPKSLKTPTLLVVGDDEVSDQVASDDPDGFHECVSKKERKRRKWRSSQSESQDTDVEPIPEETKVEISETPAQPVQPIVEEIENTEKPQEPREKQKSKQKKVTHVHVERETKQVMQKRPKRLSESEREALQLAEAIEKGQDVAQGTLSDYYWIDKLAFSDAEKSWQESLNTLKLDSKLREVKFTRDGRSPAPDNPPQGPAPQPPSNDRDSRGRLQTTQDTGADLPSGSPNFSDESTYLAAEPLSQRDVKKGISADVSSMMAQLLQTEKDLARIEKQPETDRLKSVQEIVKSLENMEPSLIDLNDRVNVLPLDDTEVDSLKADVAALRTRHVTLESQACRFKNEIENALQTGKNKNTDLDRYQALLSDLESWVSSTHRTLQEQLPKFTSVDAVRKEMDSSKCLEQDLVERNKQLSDLVGRCAGFQNSVPEAESLASQLFENLRTLQSNFTDAEAQLHRRLLTLQV